MTRAERIENLPAARFALLPLVLVFGIALHPGPGAAQTQTCAYVVTRGEALEAASGAVVVLDTATNLPTATIPIGDPPLGVPFRIAIAPNGARAYVTFRSGGGDGVAVIDTAEQAVIDTVRGAVGCGVAVSPDGKFAYAASAADNLAVIDTQSDAIVGEIPAAGGCDVRVSPNGRLVYVLGPDEVKVVDVTAAKVIDSVAVDLSRPSGQSSALALPPPGSLLYIAEDGGRTYVIETGPDRIAATVSSSCSRQGGVLYDLAATPDGRLLYATHAYDSGEGCVNVINASTQRSSLALPLKTAATAVAVTPDGSRAYVGTRSSGAPSLYVIDVRTNTVVDTVALPACGGGASPCTVEDIAIAKPPGGCSAPPSPTPSPTPVPPTSTPTETRTTAPTSTPGPCYGDCDDDGVVGVEELVRGVGIALGIHPLSECPAVDSDGAAGITIDDLVRAVNAAIVGCVAE